MKVDVEGAESEVIKSNDWSVFRPHIVCIDSVHGNDDWRTVLADNGYKQIFHDGLNDYYADSKYYKELPVVDYNYIYSSRVLSSEWAEKIEMLQKENARSIEEIKVMQKDLEDRPTADGEGLRFRTIAKVVLKKMDAYVTGKILPEPSDDVPGGNAFDATDPQDYDRAVWSAMTDNRGAGLHRKATLKGYRLSKRIVKKAAKVAKGIKK